MLLNLISNAIKFTEIGGNIDILVEWKTQEQLKFLVIDKGIGIRKKDEGKIFKLFSSIKETQNHVNVDGIGLGLVISKMIVNKFNG